MRKQIAVAVAVLVVAVFGLTWALSGAVDEAMTVAQKAHRERCARLMPLAKTHADTMQLARVDGCDFREGGAR